MPSMEFLWGVFCALILVAAGYGKVMADINNLKGDVAFIKQLLMQGKRSE